MSYQDQVLAGLGLDNSDDGGDITAQSLAEDGVTLPKGTQKTVQKPDDSEPEETIDDEGELESGSEPVYKKDQVQKIVNTRVNTYQKRLDKLKPYKEAVDRICDLTGLDFNALANRLAGMSDAEQAKILGVPVQQIEQARQTREQIRSEKGKNQELTRQVEEIQLKANPQYSDYDLYKEEIDEILDDNPRLSVRQAYLLAKGEDNITKGATRDAEQRQIARRVNAQQKGIVKPSTGTVQQGPKIDQSIVAAAKIAGMDPAEYVAYSQVDNIDAYRAMKAKQKK